MSDEYKRKAAAAALAYVEPGMRIGLGTGSTTQHLITLLGEKVKAGLDVVCVATSEQTAELARKAGIKLTTLDENPELDIAIDGCDEVDDELRLIKGGGGALLREKIVACAAQEMIVIADISKRVKKLGKFPLPVEVVQFGAESTRMIIEELSALSGAKGTVAFRTKKDGSRFVTDGGNYIVDCAFGRLDEPEVLEGMLKMTAGVVETGLFCAIATKLIVAGPKGVEEIDAPEPDFDFGPDA